MKSYSKSVLASVVALLFVFGCRKQNNQNGDRNDPSSSENRNSSNEGESSVERSQEVAQAVANDQRPSNFLKIPSGKISVKVLEKEPGAPPGLVKIRVGNGLGEQIKSARIWVLMFDSQKKMVGQKAFWLSPQGGAVLKDQETREWTTLVPVLRTPESTQITFSMIETASGRTVHPESVLISEPER